LGVGEENRQKQDADDCCRKETQSFHDRFRFGLVLIDACTTDAGSLQDGLGTRRKSDCEFSEEQPSPRRPYSGGNWYPKRLINFFAGRAPDDLSFRDLEQNPADLLAALLWTRETHELGKAP
jgi:hypothetical protein